MRVSDICTCGVVTGGYLVSMVISVGAKCKHFSRYTCKSCHFFQWLLSWLLHK